MSKYRVYELDVWGNIDDGFTVNDVFKTPRCIDIFDADTDKDILKKLSEWYVIMGNIEIDWTDSDVYVNNSDGMPLLCLHKEV